ncbi:Tudor domain-containing protein 7 [Entomortierella beljakovae]|nr:Tudor domain-containing protein 7 [Entomortierella beljakovae]
MSSNKKSKSRAMPALPTSPAPCLTNSLQNEDWPAEAQKIDEEQMKAFCREYIKTVPAKGSILEPDEHFRRITTALAQYTTRGLPGGKALPDEFLRQGSDIRPPSPEELMELYATLLRDNLDLNPKMREVLTDQTFAASTLFHGDPLDQHFHRHQHPVSRQRLPCGCGVDHGDDPSSFPEDSYEDEPYDDEDEDDDDDDEDSMDDEEYEDDDDDDDDEHDVGDGYAHHYEESSVKMMVYEDEKLKLESVRRIREEERRLEEEFRKKKALERLKQKQEKERILLLQRLRLEDEERRKREALEKQRKEKLEEEMRKKREAAEADQNARSFLFQCTMRSQIETVKQIVNATPDDSCSLTGVPRFSTTAATRIFGWEFMMIVEGVGEVSEEKGIQETLLHVAVRVGCFDLVVFFISKGAPLDALDKDGLTPLHTAAKNSSSFEICKLLVEKNIHHIDRTCIVAGRTVLHYAAQSGNADLVALLLQHHARVNPLDLKGNTPETLAKSGLESVLAEKPSKGNAKASNAKSQRFRNTLQHLQKSLAVLKEAQSRKDAQLVEQKRKDEALAREEAEKDNAARRKQEEKLEADLRRRLEEEKELERLKAMASDPNGNNNNSSKKKKKKKGISKGDTKETQSHTLSNSKSEVSMSALASSPPANNKTALAIPGPNQLTSSKVLQQSGTTTKTTNTTQTPVRIPKPKTTYRPSQLVVSRMTDMGFPLRESRKALIQTAGKVEEAIELLTSGASLADDSEDEAELAAEKAKEKARAKANIPDTAKTSSTETQVNAMSNASNSLEPVSPCSSPSTTVSAQQPLQQSNQRASHGAAPGSHPISQRSINHPVQILQRTHPINPHTQSKSVPTHVLQRPSYRPGHQQTTQNFGNKKTAPKQGELATSSSSISHPATSIANFIAPRTVQPTPPTRAPYSYGPASSSQTPKSQTTPTINTSHLNQSPQIRSPDRNTLNKSSTGDIGTIGITQKLGSIELTESQSFSPSTSFPGFSASSSWDVSMNSKGIQPTSLELPAPLTTGFQSSSAGHNPWASAGLSLSSPSILQSVGEDNGSAFGSPFLGTLSSAHHLQHTNSHQQHSQQFTASSPSIASLGYGEADLDLGNAGGEMIKDVLAMTGAIDSEEFAEFEAEYSFLDSDRSNNGPSRAVGGGRNITNNGHSSNNLWGATNGGNDNSNGMPSPIGTINGHARRYQDHGFDSNSSNGLSSDSSMGISEYSQWNSGFALDQAVYQRQPPQHLGSTAFVNSFFGNNASIPISPYNQHHLADHHTQPLGSFEFTNFGGLGGTNGAPLSSSTSSAFGSANAIGINRQQHQQQPRSASINFDTTNSGDQNHF